MKNYFLYIDGVSAQRAVEMLNELPGRPLEQHLPQSTQQVTGLIDHVVSWQLVPGQVSAASRFDLIVQVTSRA